MESQFIEACKNGNLVEVNRLLQDPNLDVHLNEEKAFSVACENGHLDVVNRLLELEGDRYINVHVKEEYAFRWACYYGHLPVVNRLLELEGDRYINVHVKEEAAFCYSCGNGHLPVVNRLLELKDERYIDVHAEKEWAFRYACRNGYLPVVNRLLELKRDRYINVHADGEYAFRWACYYGHLSVVNRLLELGGDRYINVHAGNEKAFSEACTEGHLPVVNRLLELTENRKIDVHANKEDAFVGACSNGHLSVVNRLLELDGDRYINVHLIEERAFRMACTNGHLLVVNRLLELEGDRYINVYMNKEGAFRGACRNGHLSVVNRLLELEGDRKINIGDIIEDCFLYVCKNKHLPIANRLLELKGEYDMNRKKNTTTIRNEYIELNGLLGEGGYGAVYRYYNNDENKRYAIKIMERYDNDILSAQIKDITLLKDLNHPNIIKLHDIAISQKHITMLMEKADYDLRNAIYNNKLNLDLVPQQIYSIFEAIIYCSNKNVLHLDIKPHNILVFKDGINETWKLCDFGISCQGYGCVYPDTLDTDVCTSMYKSTNLLLGDSDYDTMVDIWSLGCVLYEIYTKSFLFNNISYDSEEDIFNIFGLPTTDVWPKVVNLPYWSEYSTNYQSTKPTGITHIEITSRPELLDLLNTIFDYSNFSKPRDTDHFSKILSHPYFKDVKKPNPPKILNCLERLEGHNSIILIPPNDIYSKNRETVFLFGLAVVSQFNDVPLRLLILAYTIANRYNNIRFNTNRHIQKEELFCIMMVSIMLAIKVSGSDLSHCYLTFVDISEELTKNSITENAITENEFIQMEEDIITTLDWKIYTYTSYDYINVKLRDTNIKDENIKDTNTICMANTILLILYIYGDIHGKDNYNIAETVMDITSFLNQTKSISESDHCKMSIFKDIDVPSKYRNLIKKYIDLHIKGEYIFDYDSFNNNIKLIYK